MLQNAFVSSRLTCIGLTKKESRGAFDTSVEDQFSTRYLSKGVCASQMNTALAGGHCCVLPVTAMVCGSD